VSSSIFISKFKNKKGLLRRGVYFCIIKFSLKIMSGHSHYSTIKRRKEANDSQKGKIFSKHAKAIKVAIKSGGGADPSRNAKLHFAIEQAKSDNVPKSNIERILSRSEEMGNIEEVTYEGYGPGGVAVLVNTVTDNKNRTSQEIKNVFERGGGSLAGLGAVAFNFTPRGYLVLEKNKDSESQILELIDLGVEDVSEGKNELEVYTKLVDLSDIRDKLQELGYKIISYKLVQKPKNTVLINDPVKAKKIVSFLDLLENHDDVQDVFSNIDIPIDILEKLNLD